MRRTLACLFLFVMPAASVAQSVHIDSVQIVEKGIYTAEVKEKIENKSLTTGFRFLVTGIKRIEDTTIVPGKPGIWFGFKYQIVGEPVGTSALLKFVVKYPKPGVRNPKTQQISPSEEFTETRSLGDIHFRGYRFDLPWEVVLGTWTFEIWYEDQKLTEQGFTVVKSR